MKHKLTLLSKISAILLVTVFFLLAISIPVSADDGDQPGHVVIGSSYLLSSDETLNGDLIVLGGSATIERGAVIKGDVFIASGTANINGTVKGDITAFGGIINILGDANVSGNVVRYGGVFNLDEDAVISGNIVSNEGTDFNLPAENLPSVSGDTVNQLFSGPAYLLQQFGKFMLKVVQVIGLALIAVVLSLFLDKPLERMAKTFHDNVALSLGIGLLTVFVFPTLMVILMITLILIPVSLLGLIGFVLVTLYGWFAMALYVGDLVANMFKKDWSNPLSIGIGSLALSIISYLIGSVPCIGWIVPFLIASAGLGAAILSRGGTQLYEAEKSNVPSRTVPAIPARTAEIEDEKTDDAVEEVLEPLDLDAIPPSDDENSEGEEKQAA